jgi:hypothetical protein
MESSNKESLSYHISYARFKEMQKKQIPFEFKPQYSVKRESTLVYNTTATTKLLGKYQPLKPNLKRPFITQQDKKRTFMINQDETLPTIKRMAPKPPKPMKENNNSIANVNK